MATPKGGNFGKVLEIDLSKQTFKTRPVSDEILQQYIGGRGLGAYYAVTEYKAGKNALDEDAFVFVGPGPLSGTMAVSHRTCFAHKSPYTGLMTHAETGAHLASEIKFAGWDGLYIKGRAKKPVWLSIVNDKVEFKDASKMWGKTTDATHEMMVKEMKDPEIRTAVIGPAGENGVPFACIIVERYRAAARSGTGMVFGDKKLKGFAVRGTKYAVPVVDNVKFLAAAQVAKETNISDPGAGRRKVWGTASSLETNNFVLGSLIVKNFQTTWWPDIVKLGAEEAERKFWKRHVSCTNCQTHCLKLGVLREGKYKGLIAEAPEYESGGLLGSNLGMKDFGQMTALIEACDAYGLDYISTGGVLGFTTEAVEKGALKPSDLDGLKPTWGDGDTYMKLIDKIAYKQGKAGKLLALGVTKMSKQIGKGTDAYANVVKGRELAAHDPRGDKPRFFSYCLGTNGADHAEGASSADLCRVAMNDSLCLCTFCASGVWGASTDKIVTDMLNPLCGWTWKTDDYWLAAKRILTAERVFNVREGVSAKDDRLPKRFYAEKLPAGPKKGVVFTDEDEKKFKADAYKFLGWDEKGIPTEATLKAYNLEFLIEDLNAARKKYNL
ncbi:MAG: aldehyde ferredoxin oxidoreductase family protein [Syntrophaceae bacterium]